jgi:hypothetical protein
MYSSLPKFHWRNWMWNRLRERIKCHRKRKDSTILYLVGPDDYDRQVAIDKGFTANNLIAVDINQDCVDSVRKNKGLAIQGDICDVIAYWPEDPPINIVCADFTCGLTDKVMELFNCAMILSRGIRFGQTQLCVNLQRGRDNESNDLRTFIRGLTPEIADFPVLANIYTDPLHRGKQFFAHFTECCMRSMKGIRPKMYLLTFINQTQPIFNSYRQDRTKPFMDSVIFTFPQGYCCNFEESVRLYKEYRTDYNIPPDHNITQRIAALKAIRTMKLKGKL